MESSQKQKGTDQKYIESLRVKTGLLKNEESFFNSPFLFLGFSIQNTVFFLFFCIFFS